MQPHARFDILSKIATGDFATVFSAHDKELHRAVAIKQIHQQFLDNPKQLSRYWDEAQLLASLEHPNVLTVYDIDRVRGWLILELMMDTMQGRAAGKPMDLELIRMGLVCGLKALEFLHNRNIIHGDVKPSNLLIDRQNWIKLGDFGLAQRATNDQGSLFKGTTRYIAPERVDPEIFGPVGPHSDLYSLGFSMYELLCGNEFESLFPGLNVFGTDKQIAWMMWHAGPDRRIPPVDRVLKGVPEDIAHVIERLVTKDPKSRYRDAQEAIRDLKIGMGRRDYGMTDAEKAEAAALEAENVKQKRRKKFVIAVTIIIVIGVLGWVFYPKPEIPEPIMKQENMEGRIVQIYPPSEITAAEISDRSIAETALAIGTLVVDTHHKAHQTITIRKNDQVEFNGKPVLGPAVDNEKTENAKESFKLDDIQKDDFVRLETEIDFGAATKTQIIKISRPEETSGTIVSLRPEYRAFVIDTSTGSAKQKPIQIRFPLNHKDIKIVVNGERISIGDIDPIGILKPKDVVTSIRHNAIHSWAQMAEASDEDNRLHGRLQKYFYANPDKNQRPYEQQLSTAEKKRSKQDYRNEDGYYENLLQQINRIHARGDGDDFSLTGQRKINNDIPSQRSDEELREILNALLKNRMRSKDDRIVHPDSKIRIVRQETRAGVIKNTDIEKKTINIETAKDKSIQLPVANSCDVFLNGRNMVGDHRFSMADLKPGDAITVEFNTEAHRIDATRKSFANGVVTNIIPQARKITLTLNDEESPSRTFTLLDEVNPLLDGVSVDLQDLQPSDTVDITFDETDPKNAVISKLSAHRVPDRRLWALVIGFHAYNDKTLSSVSHLNRDALSVRDTLNKRYRIPVDQTLVIQNVVRAELKSKVSSFLRRLRNDSELIIYYTGHAYLDAYGQPQLATKDFKLRNTQATGLPLRWLIAAIENSEAKDKLLFLDISHEGSGSDLKAQPSSEKMLMILEEDRQDPALRSLNVITSCRLGERGMRSDAGGHFSDAIASAYTGLADQNGDQRVSLAEVGEYVRNLVSKKSQGSQSTALIKPGKVQAPRLSNAILEEMNSLAKKLKQPRVTAQQIATEVENLRAEATGEPEPVVMIGIAALKLKKWTPARNLFEQVPDNLIAQQGIAWTYYQQRSYDDAINTIIGLIESAGQKLGKAKNEKQLVEASRVLEWAGRLREYATTATLEKDRISEIDAEKIDNAAKAAGQRANRMFEKGRFFVADKAEDFDKAINNVTVKSAKINIRNKKIKLSNYASFNIPLAISQTMESAETKK